PAPAMRAWLASSIAVPEREQVGPAGDWRPLTPSTGSLAGFGTPRRIAGAERGASDRPACLPTGSNELTARAPAGNPRAAAPPALASRSPAEWSDVPRTPVIPTAPVA